MIYLADVTQFPGKYPYVASQVRGDPQGTGQPFLRSAQIGLSENNLYISPWAFLWSLLGGIMLLLLGKLGACSYQANSASA